MPEIDHNAYTSCLEKIFDISIDRFKYYVETLFGFQVGVAKTYLWIATFLITAQMAAIKNFEPTIFVKLISLCSVIVSAAAFIICVDFLRGRKQWQFKSCIELPDEIDKRAWEIMNSDKYSDAPYEAFMRSIIYGIADDLTHYRSTNMSRVKRLRATAWLLIISSVFGLIALFAMIA